jgi:hypothetical protein
LHMRWRGRMECCDGAGVATGGGAILEWRATWRAIGQVQDHHLSRGIEVRWPRFGGYKEDRWFQTPGCVCCVLVRLLFIELRNKVTSLFHSRVVTLYFNSPQNYGT